MSKNIEQKLDELVRDACSVVPVPKTEYRHRIEQYATERVIAELEDMHTGFSNAWNDKSAEARDTFQPILDVIAKRIAELRGDATNE